MENKITFEYQETAQPEDYKTNPEKEDVRYIFDWDEFLDSQKAEKTAHEECNSSFFITLQ